MSADKNAEWIQLEHLVFTTLLHPRKYKKNCLQLTRRGVVEKN